MISLNRKLLASLTTFTAIVAHAPSFAQKFAVGSDSLKTGEKSPLKHAGADPQCGGGSEISPHVRWSYLPQGTESLVVFMTDPDGQKGTGTSHWVVYNIPAHLDSLSEGLIKESTADYTVGINTMGDAAYRGLCAKADENTHHYTLTVVATTIKAGTLPPGLNSEQLLSAIKGKTLLGQSVVGLYR